MARQEALPLADRPGGAVPGLRGLRHVALDRPRRVVLDRPGGDPRDRARRSTWSPGSTAPTRRTTRSRRWRRTSTTAGSPTSSCRSSTPASCGAMYLIARGDPLGIGWRPDHRRQGSALAISIGCIGGIGINTAHELGHKREENERWLSKIALAQSFYGHFYIEHNRGHHVRVATPEDPASSRLGENFYQFWPRTVAGSLKSAWRLEKRRYARRKQHPFRIGNDVLNAWLMSAVLFGALIAWLGVGDRAVPGDPGDRRASRCWRSSTSWSTTACCGRRSASPARSATSGSTRRTPGTPTTSRPTCCSTTCSGTATTTPTRPGATRPCATSRSRRCCRPGTPG